VDCEGLQSPGNTPVYNRFVASVFISVFFDYAETLMNKGFQEMYMKLVFMLFMNCSLKKSVGAT